MREYIKNFVIRHPTAAQLLAANGYAAAISLPLSLYIYSLKNPQDFAFAYKVAIPAGIITYSTIVLAGALKFGKIIDKKISQIWSDFEEQVLEETGIFK